MLSGNKNNIQYALMISAELTLLLTVLRKLVWVLWVSVKKKNDFDKQIVIKVGFLNPKKAVY